MPKPLLLHRPSGLHARFFVPSFLRASPGRRYLVLSLRGERADAARLRAAQMGYVLGQAFERMRGKPVAEHKDLLDLALKTARGHHVDLTLELPGGIRIITDGSESENAEARAPALDLESLRLGALSTSLPLWQMTTVQAPLTRRTQANSMDVHGSIRCATQNSSGVPPYMYCRNHCTLMSTLSTCHLRPEATSLRRSNLVARDTRGYAGGSTSGATR